LEELLKVGAQNLTSRGSAFMMNLNSVHDESQLREDLSLEVAMPEFIRRIWPEDRGQDIAEYAVMLAVILVLVVGTIRLVGSNANNAFSSVASSVQ
jgi:Flp pilus assembly pilin Flp